MHVLRLGSGAGWLAVALGKAVAVRGPLARRKVERWLRWFKGGRLFAILKAVGGLAVFLARVV